VSNSIKQYFSENAKTRHRHAHLIGICGIGMAGLAFLLKEKGFKVTGCDICRNRMAAWLAERGIEVLPGHAPAHIAPDITLVIRSAAVSPHCAEIRYARKLKIPVFTRGMVLPELLTGLLSVAVSGTHGKTTTSSFIVQLLKSAGQNPSWCIGGEISKKGNIGVSGCGLDKTIVVEADESDGTLVLYRPDIAVVTNIEFDHMEHFKSRNAFVDCFRSFIKNTEAAVIYCADAPELKNIFHSGQITNNKQRLLSYGFGDNAYIRAFDLRETYSRMSFVLQRGTHKLGRVELPVIGRHNAYNALAAVTAAFELGLNFREIKTGLKRVSLPRRRFERIVDKDGILVISDYAHHPSEISALVQTASKLKHKRLSVVFQPHRYTRTRALKSDFPPAFEGVDKLILTSVYAASEKPLPGGMICDLYSEFRIQHSKFEISLASSLGKAWGHIKQQLQDGDILLIIGAGDIEKISDWAREKYGSVGVSECGSGGGEVLKESFADTPILPHTDTSEIRCNEPLANKTTLKAGGRADIWAKVGSIHDLVILLKWTYTRHLPFNLIGGGSNVLISDLGLRGITARLTGKEFLGMEANAGILKIGAGVHIARMMQWLEDHNLAGLDFLEGVPGTVGGALRMNAGAYGDELGRHVSWIRCLKMDGSECMVKQSKLNFGYRSCKYLEDKIVIEAGIIVGKDKKENIQRRRSKIAKRRQWMRGLHSAGSIFKNPESDKKTLKNAGELIEKAGMKGFSIGGASVSRRHANIFITKKGVYASDVKCLIEKVRKEVYDQFGIKLDTEIEIF